jgi:Trk K+ transport system NAD-binding subunit
MAGHFIVCGFGDVGFRVAELLHRLGEEMVVVTRDAREERLEMARAAGVRLVFGDARSEHLLHEAGVATARGVIAVTDQDLVNIEIALDARRSRPDVPIVVRLFDQSLARQLETSFDLRRALGTPSLAAPSFAAAALGEAILSSFTVGDAPFVVGRAVVEERSLLHRCDTLGRIARAHGLVALARERPDEECLPLPARDTPVRAGDRLSLLARKQDWDRLFAPPSPAPPDNLPLRHRLGRILARPREIWREEPRPLRNVVLALCALIPLTVLLFHFTLGLSFVDAIFYTITSLHGEVAYNPDNPGVKLYEALLMILGAVTVATLYSLITDYLVASRLRKILGEQKIPRAGHVVVVGLTPVGYRVVGELRQVGMPVVAVHSDAGGPLVAATGAEAPVVIGDARVADILEKVGMAKARAVVAATDDDALNLSVGLAAKKVNPGLRAVVRLFDADFARKVETVLGLDAALSASRIAAPTLAASALYPDVAKAFIVKDRLFVLLLRPAGPEWVGWKPSQLREERGVQILLRGGELARDSLTAGDERPLAEDEVVLAAAWRTVAPPWTESAPPRAPLEAAAGQGEEGRKRGETFWPDRTL